MLCRHTFILNSFTQCGKLRINNHRFYVLQKKKIHSFRVRSHCLHYNKDACRHYSNSNDQLNEEKQTVTIPLEANHNECFADSVISALKNVQHISLFPLWQSIDAFLMHQNFKRNIWTEIFRLLISSYHYASVSLDESVKRFAVSLNKAIAKDFAEKMSNTSLEFQEITQKRLNSCKNVDGVLNECKLRYLTLFLDMLLSLPYNASLEIPYTVIIESFQPNDIPVNHLKEFTETGLRIIKTSVVHLLHYNTLLPYIKFSFEKRITNPIKIFFHSYPNISNLNLIVSTILREFHTLSPQQVVKLPLFLRLAKIQDLFYFNTICQLTLIKPYKTFKSSQNLVSFLNGLNQYRLQIPGKYPLVVQYIQLFVALPSESNHSHFRKTDQKHNHHKLLIQKLKGCEQNELLEFKNTHQKNAIFLLSGLASFIPTAFPLEFIEVTESVVNQLIDLATFNIKNLKVTLFYNLFCSISVFYSMKRYQSATNQLLHLLPKVLLEVQRTSKPEPKLLSLLPSVAQIRHINEKTNLLWSALLNAVETTALAKNINSYDLSRIGILMHADASVQYGNRVFNIILQKIKDNIEINALNNQSVNDIIFLLKLCVLCHTKSKRKNNYNKGSVTSSFTSRTRKEFLTLAQQCLNNETLIISPQKSNEILSLIFSLETLCQDKILKTFNPFIEYALAQLNLVSQEQLEDLVYKHDKLLFKRLSQSTDNSSVLMNNVNIYRWNLAQLTTFLYIVLNSNLLRKKSEFFIISPIIDELLQEIEYRSGLLTDILSVKNNDNSSKRLQLSQMQLVQGIEAFLGGENFPINSTKIGCEPQSPLINKNNLSILHNAKPIPITKKTETSELQLFFSNISLLDSGIQKLTLSKIYCSQLITMHQTTEIFFQVRITRLINLFLDCSTQLKIQRGAYRAHDTLPPILSVLAMRTLAKDTSSIQAAQSIENAYSWDLSYRPNESRASVISNSQATTKKLENNEIQLGTFENIIKKPAAEID